MNNKGADQSVPLLFTKTWVSNFVICLLESIIWASSREDLSSGLTTWSYTTTQQQRLARKLKLFNVAGLDIIPTNK